MCRNLVMFSMRPGSSFLVLLAVLVFSIQCNRKGPHQALDTKAKNGAAKSGTQTGAGTDGLNIQYSEVEPLFAKSCGECHKAGGVSPNWGDEQAAVTAAKSGKLARRVGALKNMPPPGSPQANALKEQERELIHQWALSIEAKKSATPPIPSSSGGTAHGGGHEPTPLPGTELTTEIPSVSPSTSAPQEHLSVSQQCFVCHGEKGLSSISGYPHLAGQSASYLNQQLNDFREGKRKDSISGAMNAIASSLSREDQEKVVSYFSGLPSPLSVPPYNGKIENLNLLIPQFNKGQVLARELGCNGCHTQEANFRPGMAEWPDIAGQDSVYVKSQLAAIQSGERTNAPTMGSVLKSRRQLLTDEELQALGIYFQNLRPEKTESKQ